MVDAAKAIEAITESRPPATDRFTYLTIIGEHASPEILPTLNDILQDPNLTQEIGWDLIQILLPIPGNEACLETVARLGNPREVILAVLGALSTIHSPARLNDPNGEAGSEEDGGVASTEGQKQGAQSTQASNQFITLLGILAILHRRLKVKRPSRFLASTLQTVLQTYDPANNQMTGAVINLVHSLSGRRRPPLPTRKSSLSMSGILDRDNNNKDDGAKNAPDPEADEGDGTAPDDEAIQARLLLSFVSCTLDAYVNANSLAWSTRLLEFYNPEKVFPGRQSALQAYREDEELSSRDAIVGQLVALTKDLGLSLESREFLEAVVNGPLQNNPLAGTDDGVYSPAQVSLPSGGSVALLAYRVFSNDVFEADQPQPQLFAFPEYYSILEKFLQDDAQGQIVSNPGAIDAVVALGLWLVHHGSVVPEKPDQLEEVEADYMNFHMLLTLIAVYHPAIHVRNAATTLAGLILHADPDANDRLKILYDLLENCMFGTLKACAVTWLREELMAASSTGIGSGPTSSPFSGPEAVDTVQYAVYPNLESMRDADKETLSEWWAQNAAFVLQAVNFALLLFHDQGTFAHVVPDGMATAIEMRYVDPLAAMAEALAKGARSEGDAATAPHDAKSELALEVDILQDRLRRLRATKKFHGVAVGDNKEGAGA